MRPESLRQVDRATWELPRGYKEGMQVPVRVFATKSANVAALPGIVGYSYCMPDGHWGYGFPIGGIGFDINCGMRLVATDLTYPEIEKELAHLVDALVSRIRR